MTQSTLMAPCGRKIPQKKGNKSTSRQASGGDITTGQVTKTLDIIQCCTDLVRQLEGNDEKPTHKGSSISISVSRTKVGVIIFFHDSNGTEITQHNWNDALFNFEHGATRSRVRRIVYTQSDARQDESDREVVGLTAKLAEKVLRNW